MTNEKVITQLSIFIGNEPGSLASMARALKENDVNLKAFNIAESAGFGVFRAIVENPDEAFVKLKNKNLIIKKTEVVAVSVNDAPGGLFSAANVLGDAEINIEYGYAHEGKAKPIIFFRVDKPEEAIAVFEKAGMTVITPKDI